MSPIHRKPESVEFQLQDRVSVRDGSATGRIWMKLHTDPKIYCIKTDNGLLPNFTAEELLLLEAHAGERRSA